MQNYFQFSFFGTIFPPSRTYTEEKDTARKMTRKPERIPPQIGPMIDDDCFFDEIFRVRKSKDSLKDSFAVWLE